MNRLARLAVLWGLSAVAGVKVAVGIPSALFAQPPGNPSPSRWFLLAQVLTLTAGATYLALGGRKDQRAQWLALTFLLGASAFADPLLARAAQMVPALAGLYQPLRALQVAAFLPYTIWSFFDLFPRVTTFSPVARIPRILREVGLVVGASLFIANVITALEPPQSRLFRLVDRDTSGGLYWPLLFLLTTGAFVFGVWNTRNARLEEQRRVRLLITALVLGCLPILGVVLVSETWQSAHRLLSEPKIFAVAEWLVYVPLFFVPLVTAYAVHVHQALDVRFYVRRAIRYALARYTVSVLAAVPFIAFLVLVYRGRDRRVVELLSSRAGAGLLIAGVGGIIVARTRHRVLEAVDRRFFREHYDTTRILGELVGGMRHVGNVTELEGLVTGEIDRALHAQNVALLVLNAQGDRFVSRTGRSRALPASARLVARLRESGEPLRISIGDLAAVTLSDDDRSWLSDGGFVLLVPLRDANDTLFGVLALGEKRSELPYTPEDDAILAAVGSATAIVLERRLLTGERSSEGGGASTANVCSQCGLVSSSEVLACPRCGGTFGEATVPLILAGKFRLEERVGAGGMGVVYRARDLVLDRPVAIKTLRPMGMLFAWRLRREARAMALVTHPNLASIYGLEAWNGTPMLVVEYLQGGTLGSRIARGPLPVEEALALGTVLLGVVERIHRAGILHRDIKPSNIGFTGDGIPKLLDFGLARMIDNALGEGQGAGVPTDRVGDTVAEASSVTGTGIALGTPEYMSPEATAGDPPDPSFDLWSVAVVLYEMLAGHPPFRGAAPAQTLRLIRAGGAPDVRDAAPGCPSGVAEFLQDALAVERSRRPSTARAMNERLAALRAGELAKG